MRVFLPFCYFPIEGFYQEGKVKSNWKGEITPREQIQKNDDDNNNNSNSEEEKKRGNIFRFMQTCPGDDSTWLGVSRAESIACRYVSGLWGKRGRERKGRGSRRVSVKQMRARGGQGKAEKIFEEAHSTEQNTTTTTTPMPPRRSRIRPRYLLVCFYSISGKLVLSV